MKSAWWWGTPQWEAYQQEYYQQGYYYALDKRPEEYKTSPLADDHDFSCVGPANYEFIRHDTQVIDLTQPVEQLWQGVRASYHSIIHRAQERYSIKIQTTIRNFQTCHFCAFGEVRDIETFAIQNVWLSTGNGFCMAAFSRELGASVAPVAAAYWIVYQDCAYYASGPSTEHNVQHAVIWESLVQLKRMGMRLVEMGQIDGETEKERNIGKFKQGFGGQAVPFTIARRS